MAGRGTSHPRTQCNYSAKEREDLDYCFQPGSQPAQHGPWTPGPYQLLCPHFCPLKPMCRSLSGLSRKFLFPPMPPWEGKGESVADQEENWGCSVLGGSTHLHLLQIGKWQPRKMEQGRKKERWGFQHELCRTWAAPSSDPWGLQGPSASVLTFERQRRTLGGPLHTLSSGLVHNLPGATGRSSTRPAGRCPALSSGHEKPPTAASFS